MKDIVKSKTMIGFLIFILGFFYINIPTLNYSEDDQEFITYDQKNSTYNV